MESRKWRTQIYSGPFFCPIPAINFSLWQKVLLFYQGLQKSINWFSNSFHVERRKLCTPETKWYTRHQPWSPEYLSLSIRYRSLSDVVRLTLHQQLSIVWSTDPLQISLKTFKLNMYNFVICNNYLYVHSQLRKVPLIANRSFFTPSPTLAMTIFFFKPIKDYMPFMGSFTSQ